MNETQKKIFENLAEELFSLMKNGVKGMWKNEDNMFLKQLSVDVAREKILAETSDNPDEHIKNLEHLAATLQGEIVRRGLKIRAFRQDMFVKIITMIIRTVALPLLKTIVNK